MDTIEIIVVEVSPDARPDKGVRKVIRSVTLDINNNIIE